MKLYRVKHYEENIDEHKERAKESYERNAKRIAYKMFRRRHWISLYKTRMGCLLCGYNAYPEALEFDHLDPEIKHKNVGELYSGKISTLINEIRKCRVLCANCHSVETKRLGHSGRGAHHVSEFNQQFLE